MNVRDYLIIVNDHPLHHRFTRWLIVPTNDGDVDHQQRVVNHLWAIASIHYGDCAWKGLPSPLRKGLRRGVFRCILRLFFYSSIGLSVQIIDWIDLKKLHLYVFRLLIQTKTAVRVIFGCHRLCGTCQYSCGNDALVTRRASLHNDTSPLAILARDSNESPVCFADDN